MEFTPALLDPDNPANVQAWASDTGRWRIEVNRVMYGYRVNLLLGIGKSYEVDYCAGNSAEWVEALVTVVMSILRLWPEQMLLAEMYPVFPIASVKPIAKNVVCWALLCERAGVEPDTPIGQIGDVTFDWRQAHRIQNYMLCRFGGMDEAVALKLLQLASVPLPSLSSIGRSSGPDPHENVPFFP